MFEVTEYEIVTLLRDEQFVNEVIEQALASPEVVEELGDDWSRASKLGAGGL